MFKLLKNSRPTRTDSGDHAAYIDFLYQILFGRNAEPVAIDTWTKYLSIEEYSYKDLFEHLWMSDEFQQKAEQNRYLQRPPMQNEAITHSTNANDLITDDYFKLLASILEKDRMKLFDISTVRTLVAQWRYRDLQAQENIVYHEGAQADVLPNTAEHNELSLRSSVGFDRGVVTTFPLRAVGWLLERIDEAKVLVVGARTENELFALLALGFKAENVTMIDLISCSPYFEVGDMHNLRFKDNTFDVVLLSHVLLYSSSPKKAAHELCRVAKSGALISYFDRAAQFDPPTAAPEHLYINSEPFSDCQGVLDTFSPYDGTVIFRLEPKPPYTELAARICVMFEVDKSRCGTSG